MADNKLPVLTAQPQEWEFEPIHAVAVCDFSLHAATGKSGYLGAESVAILISFKQGEAVVGAWSNREFITPQDLHVDFEKMGFKFRLKATYFFRLFNKVANG